jgi:hypothetical protein
MEISCKIRGALHRLVRPRSTRAVAAVALGLCFAGSAFADQAGTPVTQNVRGTMKADLQARSPDIHWPDRYKPMTADLFAHNGLLIEASCETVWKHLIDAEKWRQWYPNSKDVQLLDGPRSIKGVHA